MSNCPICNTKMHEEERSIEPGVFAKVEVCPKCADDWVDENEYERLYQLFKRRAFKIGGSIAVRIPKEIADTIGLRSGDDVKLSIRKKSIVIEPA